MTDIETLASILEGEAGALGRTGMLLVAGTIMERLTHGQTIDRVAKEYFGRSDHPNDDATAPAVAAP